MSADPGPDHGLRFTLDRRRGDTTGPCRYSGSVLGSDLEVRLEATVALEGEDVKVEVVGEPVVGSPEDAARVARAAIPLLRTVVRSAVVRGQTPPRRIQRWRER
ncbi:MAG: hypothetical protein FJ095_17385 [Deltaproteobacteria bacterium]|nr:hypothetical protein [Deltaproteobacteria bacterium]